MGLKWENQSLVSRTYSLGNQKPTTPGFLLFRSPTPAQTAEGKDCPTEIPSQIGNSQPKPRWPIKNDVFSAKIQLLQNFPHLKIVHEFPKKKHPQIGMSKEIMIFLHPNLGQS